MEDQSFWSTKVNIIQYVINNTYHSSIKATPTKILFGYDQRNHADFQLVRLFHNVAKVELNVEKDRREAREVALEATK